MEGEGGGSLVPSKLSKNQVKIAIAISIAIANFDSMKAEAYRPIGHHSSCARGRERGQRHAANLRCPPSLRSR